MDQVTAMKRQKKYTSREMILKGIDAAHRKIKRLRKQADELTASALLYAEMGNEVKAKAAREDSEKLWEQSNRVENKRLKKLGATLAAFDTVPLGIEGLNQEQVVLERV